MSPFYVLKNFWGERVLRGFFLGDVRVSPSTAPILHYLPPPIGTPSFLLSRAPRPAPAPSADFPRSFLFSFPPLSPRSGGGGVVIIRGLYMIQGISPAIFDTFAVYYSCHCIFIRYKMYSVFSPASASLPWNRCNYCVSAVSHLNYSDNRDLRHSYPSSLIASLACSGLASTSV